MNMRASSFLLLVIFSVDCLAQSARNKYVLSEAEAKEIVENVLKLSPVIDGHNDLFVQYFDCKTCPRDIRAYRLDTISKGQTDIPRWRKGGVGGQLLNVFGNDKSIEAYLHAYDLLYRIEETYPSDIKIVGTSAEMRQVIKDGKIAILPALEGATRLKNNLSFLRTYYKLGLRSVTFAYSTNDLADGSDDIVRHHGISGFGKEMVKEMNRLGILIDISHVSAEAMNDILDITQAPVIFSHSNARSLCQVSRNVPDNVLKRLKENNGLIMLTFVPYFTTNEFNNWMILGDTNYYRAVRKFRNNKDAVNTVMEKWEKDNPMPAVTVADIANHFDYVKKLIGVDHIGMAGDYDGISFTIQGMEDASSYPLLLIELAKRGWTEQELRKITGENFLRVFEEAEKVSAQLKKQTVPSLVKYKH